MYRDECIKLCKDLGIPVANSWGFFNEKDWNEIFSDGVHLTPRGNEEFGIGLLKVIREKFSDM